MTKRLASALAAYAVLIAIAAWRLSGKMLYAVLIVFGYFIVRTLIAVKIDSDEPARDEADRDQPEE